MSPINTHKPPTAQWSWPFGTALVLWTALMGILTYSYADASPPHAIKMTPATGATTASAAEGLTRASQLSDAFADIAERVSPSVVTIKVETKREGAPGMFGMPFFGAPNNEAPGVARGSGSGVVFRADGAILTNHHVVEKATRIDVTLRDGRTFRAKVVGADQAVDLAVLKIDAKALPVATFADSSRARVGEWVLAIGAPFGLDYTLTAGVLSAKGRGVGANEIEDYLQTDASINPGNSGGPLVDLDGHVLGINTMIIGRGSGIGFAIPADIARDVADQLLTTGKVRRAWLGVSFQELTPEVAQGLGRKDTHGALVAGVQAGGPAERGGVKPGDVIERVDQQVVTEGRDLLRAVLRKTVGADVTLGVWRDGKLQALKVKTAERPSDARKQGMGAPDEASEAGALGLELQDLSPRIASQLGYRGDGKVVVSGVNTGSPADAAGLQRGDVIVEADRRAVSSAADVRAALTDGKALLRVDRDRGSFYTVLSTGD
jgi:serine protease Do